MKRKEIEILNKIIGENNDKYTYIENNRDFNITIIKNNKKKKECYLISNEFSDIMKINYIKEKERKKQKKKDFTKYDHEFTSNLDDGDDEDDNNSILCQNLYLYIIKRDVGLIYSIE